MRNGKCEIYRGDEYKNIRVFVSIHYSIDRQHRFDTHKNDKTKMANGVSQTHAS